MPSSRERNDFRSADLHLKDINGELSHIITTPIAKQGFNQHNLSLQDVASRYYLSNSELQDLFSFPLIRVYDLLMKDTRLKTSPSIGSGKSNLLSADKTG